VTGVRFTKKNRIFHLQVQDGVVRKHGSIDADTVRWVPINEMTLHGRSVVEGRDYWMMDWQQRAVDLDDLVAPPKHVLTGLRFRRLGTHLNLVIRVTPIDIQTGKLQPSNSFWLDHEIEPIARWVASITRSAVLATREPKRERGVNCRVTLASHQSAWLVSRSPRIGQRTQREEVVASLPIRLSTSYRLSQRPRPSTL